MTTLAYTVPVPGTDLNAIADPELVSALNTIKTWANGSIDAVNLSALLAQSVGANQNAQVVKGISNISNTETRTNVAYGTLATPDQVTGIVLPTGGLIRVWYAATWSESVAGTARAAIFIGSNQLKTLGAQVGRAPVTQAAATNLSGFAGSAQILSSCPAGLFCAAVSNATGYTGDVTTGQAGVASSAFTMEVNGTVSEVDTTFPYGFGGPCDIDNLPAGTYTISVQYKASSGTVTASNRRLRVQVISFT